jgi:cytochrome c oxidase subunit IV
MDLPVPAAVSGVSRRPGDRVGIEETETMADTTHGGEHGSKLFNIYMIVALALAICTISSFAFNGMMRSEMISPVTSFLLILSVAILKAVLVAMFFMHLKWDWSTLYFLIVPAFILGAMMMMVLMPDILIGPYQDAVEEIQISREIKTRP